ncbi:hypothetical protein ACFIQF_14360 [Comamonas sp. J-3]|uniref:hypothetical protein n=1 Tax=Comamonas trifloxystrobinivorans TaxID=3350256 RepID=UPI00372C707F
MIDRDTIIAVATKYAICTSGQHKEFLHEGLFAFVDEIAQAVAQKAVEGEREACEMAVEGIAQTYSEDSPGRWMANKCLQAIRNRSTGDQVSSNNKETRMSTSNPVVTDDQIDEIFNSMPDGANGFLKSWGYRQFARKLLELRRTLPSAPKSPPNQQPA